MYVGVWGGGVVRRKEGEGENHRQYTDMQIFMEYVKIPI
jgi:hypothetical protein